MCREPKDEADASARPLGPAILRVAGWPIESLEPLRAPDLAARIDRWIANEDEIRQTSRLLAALLHELIPRIAQGSARGAALTLKRALIGTLGPLPQRPSTSLLQDPAISAAIGSTLLANAADRERHAAERAAIEQAHAAEIDRAGAALDRIVQDPDFQRAVCVASASLFSQLQRAQRITLSRRGRQRLQSALHRYLMRAIGRATPNGLWAGVALETVSDQAQAPVQVRPAPAVIRVSPVLSVFLRALAHLNRSRPWIDQLTWRRNPTLRRLDDAQWEFGTFSGGFWVVGRIAPNAALDVLLSAFDGADRTLLHDIERALCANIIGIAPSLARTICESWIEAGILWSTASLPPFFADTWQALETTIGMLPDDEAQLWKASLSGLRSIADRIEASIETIEPDALRIELDAGQRMVATLLERYGAALHDDEDVLVIDRTAPFRFSLSLVSWPIRLQGNCDGTGPSIATGLARSRPGWRFPISSTLRQTRGSRSGNCSAEAQRPTLPSGGGLGRIGSCRVPLASSKLRLGQPSSAGNAKLSRSRRSGFTASLPMIRTAGWSHCRRAPRCCCLAALQWIETPRCA